MAETYSTEYAALTQVTLGSKTFAYGNNEHNYPFHYTQVANGNIADTIVLARLKPKAILKMDSSFFRWTGHTATATLDIGWKAYKDVNGDTVAADADGLIDGVVLTTDNAWNGGILITGAAASAPIVWEKDFNNAEEVVIYATIGVAIPAAAATLNGHFVCRHA